MKAVSPISTACIHGSVLVQYVFMAFRYVNVVTAILLVEDYFFDDFCPRSSKNMTCNIAFFFGGGFSYGHYMVADV